MKKLILGIVAGVVLTFGGLYVAVQVRNIQAEFEELDRLTMERLAVSSAGYSDVEQVRKWATNPVNFANLCNVGNPIKVYGTFKELNDLGYGWALNFKESPFANFRIKDQAKFAYERPGEFTFLECDCTHVSTYPMFELGSCALQPSPLAAK